jgi:23S rRNA-/tRNA-specific pseudouridylate synthase
MDGSPPSGVTMETLVRHWCEGEDMALDPNEPMRFCHRLDLGTSGILVAGLTREAASVCGSAFADRTTTKVYSAVCCGELDVESIPWSTVPLLGAYRRPVEDAEGQTFVINVPVAPLSPGDFRMAAFVTPPPPLNGTTDASKKKPRPIKPKAAETLVRVLDTPRYCGYSVTRLRLTPLTGRRHQLRVHLSHIGHPLVGDATYDGGALAGAAPRMMLHAMELGIPLGPGSVLKATTPNPFVAISGELQPLLQVPLKQCRAEITVSKQMEA